MAHFRSTLLWLVILTAPARAAEYVNEPLTSPVSGRRGGTFGANGWTTTAVNDTLWWVIPDALESGSVEFDVTGFSLSTTLTGEDHDIVTLHQAPDGVGNPAPYSPYFRNNDMRVMLRVFGSAEGSDRAGATKLEGIQCMVAPPWYDNACPAGCADYDGIAYAHGRTDDIGWVASETYHFSITWSGTTMQWFRNSGLMGTLNYPDVFAPQPLVVHMGSPRNGASNGVMPIGVTFSNVRISGTPGTRTPICNAAEPPPDAGPSVVDPCTDGSTGAIADVVAASFSNGVFPDPTDLNVEADGSGNPTAVGYVMFPPQPTSVSLALLRMRTRPESSSAGGSGQVCLVSSSAWDENTMTWADRPAVSTTCSGGAHAVAADTEVEWDVTSLMGGSGNLTFAIVTADGNGVHYFSREAGGCARGPRLFVTPAPPDAGSPVDAAPPVDAAVPHDAAGPPDAAAPRDAATPRDAASPVTDAGSSRDAGATPRDAGGVHVVDAGEEPTDMEPCGCESTGAGTPAGALALLCVAWTLSRRRRCGNGIAPARQS